MVFWFACADDHLLPCCCVVRFHHFLFLPLAWLLASTQASLLIEWLEDTQACRRHRRLLDARERLRRARAGALDRHIHRLINVNVLGRPAVFFDGLAARANTTVWHRA